MKSNTEIADTIVEEILFGNYESKLLDIVANFARVGYNWTPEAAAQTFDNLYGACSAYCKPNSDKERLAQDIIDLMLSLRTRGVMLNNPNTARHIAQERDFYKSRTTRAEERTKDVEDKLKSAYITIDKLMEDIEGMKLKGFEKKE